MVKSRTVSLYVGGLGIVLIPGPARADCSTGPDYFASINNTSITVCAGSEGRSCGSGIAMLRQNVADGTVVDIGNNCDAGCYLDDCVPAGTYRYGYATSYDCSQTGCDGRVALFREVTMPSWASPDCTRRSTVLAPTATKVTPPWGTDAGIQQYLTCPDGGGGCAMATGPRWTVRGLNALAFGIGVLLIGLRARHRCDRAVKRQS
jgi:hypothetical protein